jgi:hypothetical protein
MRFKLLLIGAAIAVVATMIGVSGFTTATVERQADIDVTDDTDGLIGLDAGDQAQIISTNGKLTIDMSQTRATGVNQDATFTFGNSSDPSKTAFNITNQDGEEQTFGLDFQQSDDPVPGRENVNFSVYKSSGDRAFSETDGDGTSSSTGVTLDAGESAYVVITVDTTGAKGKTLDGTLEVTV